MKTAAKLAVTASVLMGAGAAQANVAAYELAWRGVAIGEFEVAVDAEAERYHISYEARSTGILAVFFPFESRGWSAGAISDGEVLASNHSAMSSFRDQERNWTIGFGADGAVTELDINADGDEREPVPAALQRAPDPLALALSALQDASPGVEIEGQSFDGRRAVRVEMSCPEADENDVELTCTIEGELLAGASKRWRDEHEGEPPVRRPVNVRLSRTVMNDLWWPVWLEVESRFGPVTATMVDRSS